MLNVFQWDETSFEGRESMVKEHQRRQSSTSQNKVLVNIASLIVFENYPKTIHELADMLSISVGSAHLHTDIGMKWVCCSCIPKLLTPDQIEHQVNVCQEFKGWFEEQGNAFLHLITIDKLWIYHYNATNKQQITQWKTPRSSHPSKKKKKKKKKGAGKVVMITFLDNLVIQII
jgi:hypothetical protein